MKAVTKDEKPRVMSPYLKSFAKKIDPDNVGKEVLRDNAKKKDDLLSPLQDQGSDVLNNESLS